MVLIVDDDTAFRQTIAIMLHIHGIKTLIAANGLEALEKLQKNPKVSAVLIDLLMPMMDGEETCRQIRRFWTDMPIILTSGFELGLEEGRFGNPPPDYFLQKPFSFAALTTALAAVLH